MEKSEITSECRQQGGKQVGAAQDRKPRQIASAEQTGEHDASSAEINRGAGVLDGVLLIADLYERQQAAEQPDDSQDQQGQQSAVKRYPRRNAHAEQHEHERVVRRRLDEGDRAERHGDEQHDVQQPLRQRR